MPDLMNFNHEDTIMPHATIVLPDVYETVARSVAVDVVRQIAQYMSLPQETAVYLPGRSGTVPMNDGMFGNCCDAANSVHFDPAERVTIKYEETAEENFTLSTAVKNNENYPVFVDVPHGIYFRPVRRYVDFRIDIEYQAPNIVLAQRWLDDQRMRLSMGAGDLTFTLEYHYNIPLPALGLLKGLYDTIQKSGWPTDKTFEEWTRERWTMPTTNMVTINGSNPTLSVYERQVDVVGHFDFINTPNTPEQASDKSGAYTVNFSYICRYERPTHLYVKYPMVMNQCPIPKVFRREFTYQNYQQAKRKESQFRTALDLAFILKREKNVSYIQYPDTDDWVAKWQPQQKFTFFSGLITLDCNDPTFLLDLNTLGRFTFTPHFLDFFQGVGAKAFNGNGRSFMQIRLYKNDEYLNIPLTMEQGSTKVYSSIPLDPEYFYHVQISFEKNFYAISDDLWQCMRRYPTVCWSLFNFFGVGIGRKPMAQMELLGVGRERVLSTECPGEGKTSWLDDVVHYATGIVKWSDIQDARKEEDSALGTGGNKGSGGSTAGGGAGSGAYINMNNFGPVTQLWANVISDKKTTGV